MPITTVGIGAAVTPTVIKTYLSHYTDRKPRRQKPTAHISYDEGLHVIRSFLEYASHHTVEDLQAFTAQWVPNPTWVRTENVPVPQEYITKSADTIIAQLGNDGVQQVGGQKWWQWRRQNAELKGEWIEMRADYNARKQLQGKCRRVMLYVHGGAYFFGSVDEHRYQMQRHARKLKAKVFAPRYRLAPQFPFPCGLQDCLASYLYLLSLHRETEIILAGDSAGGGMVMSMLCILRDQGLPLPAGAILISPWVDLTHSFPSVAGDNKFDYIPAHGFMQKPSVSWPPPNDADMEAIAKGAGENLVGGRHKLEKPSVQKERSQGVVVHDPAKEGNLPTASGDDGPTREAIGNSQNISTIPGPSRQLSIEIDGRTVELRDQIQMYTTNQLLSHPLVSPVLQPSLGGLPPLLILTGGGEVLRDEQIYLAHKAANPAKYALGDAYRNRYDPGNVILNQHKPTSVYLQVWEDLCHVAPTLSFTRPAKYMYRSVAQFGAWALSRAQETSIELEEDDALSVISGSESETDEIKTGSQNVSAKEKTLLGAVGKAGDPIPPFKQHMIRQRIDRHGNIFPLEAASALPALQMSADQVGVIKVGPVKKWMDAKQMWDTKYARSKRRVQRKRIEDLARKQKMASDNEEIPPPSALAGRRHEEKQMVAGRLKKSFYLAMWSGWGSKHDEDTLRREEEAGSKQEGDATVEKLATENAVQDDKKSKKSRSLSRSRKASDSKKAKKEKEGRSVSANKVSKSQPQVPVNEASPPTEEQADHLAATRAAAGGAAAVAAGGTGVLAGNHQNHDQSTAQNADRDIDQTLDEGQPQGLYVSRFKTQPHLRADSKDVSDAASVRTGISALSIPDNASTTAVFAAAGVSKERHVVEPTDPRSPLSQSLGRTNSGSDKASTIRGSVAKRPGSALGGYDTPSSRRSVERLMSHQIDVTGPDGETVSVLSADMNASGGKSYPTQDEADSEEAITRQQMTRSPSSMAVVQAEGVVGVFDGGDSDPVTPTKAHKELTTKMNADHTTPPRPGMYDRSDTEFQTAMERL